MESVAILKRVKDLCIEGFYGTVSGSPVSTLSIDLIIFDLEKEFEL